MNDTVVLPVCLPATCFSSQFGTSVYFFAAGDINTYTETLKQQISNRQNTEESLIYITSTLL